MSAELALFTNGERIACGRADCLAEEGDELFGFTDDGNTAIVCTGGSNHGVLYSRVNDAALQELGALLASTRHFTLQCVGGHVEYDLGQRQLRALAQLATSAAGTARS